MSVFRFVVGTFRLRIDNTTNDLRTTWDKPSHGMSNIKTTLYVLKM